MHARKLTLKQQRERRLRMIAREQSRLAQEQCDVLELLESADDTTRLVAAAHAEALGADLNRLDSEARELTTSLN